MSLSVWILQWAAEQNAKNQIYKPSKLQELEEKMIKEQLIRESQAKQNVLSQNVSKMDKPVSVLLLSL